MQIGPFPVPRYTTLLHLGLLTGAVLIYLESRRRDLPLMPVADVALAAGVGSVLLGRAMHVGMHWGYYQTHIAEAMLPWHGGLAWQGALLGGVTAGRLACAVRGLPLMPMLDLLALGAAPVAVFAWLGCHTAGCAYGMETYPGQGMLWRLSLDLPDLYGIREPRVPVQLLGAGWSALLLLLVGVLTVGRRSRRQGVTFALWLLLQGLGAFGLGFWRGDSVPQIGGWRVDQLANLLLIGGAVVVGAVAMLKRDGSRARRT